MYTNCEIRTTDYFSGGRGVFATTDIAEDTVVHVCANPFAFVIFAAWKKEICATCLAYGQLKIGTGNGDDRFCPRDCREKADADVLEKKAITSMAVRRENERRRKASRGKPMEASNRLLCVHSTFLSWKICRFITEIGEILLSTKGL
jgi:hypothetical protein